MPGHARKDIVRKGEIGVYHTWSRCVQRAFLCGQDPVSGNNYDYRREWIAKLLEYQASVFAVDVGNYTILSNHQHLIVRLRPDIAMTWSDEEVAWRWKLAWPTWTNGRWIRQPTDEEIEEILADPQKIPLLRENLADLSWFMARWKEPISKMANAESRTKGHFYEQRFGSRELVDDGGALSCNVYLDLNQLKAGMAKLLEDCRYSGIHDRIRAWQQREAVASLDKFRAESSDGYALGISDVETLLADCFLSPIGEAGPLILVDARGAAMMPTIITPTEDLSEPMSIAQATEVENGVDEAPGPIEPEPALEAIKIDEDKGASDSDLSTPPSEADSADSVAKKKPTWNMHRRLQRRRRPRASDHVILAMPPEQYLKLVRLSAEQLRSDPARPPPDELGSILGQYGIEPASWLAVLEHFETWFHHAVGSAENLAATVSRMGQRWLQGVKACRDVFG